VGAKRRRERGRTEKRQTRERIGGRSGRGRREGGRVVEEGRDDRDGSKSR
jgi:hypothetical protein